MSKKNNSKQGKGNQTSLEHVCIVTASQDSEYKNYLHSSAPVNVLVSGNILVQKQAGDVKKGDIIVMKKNYLETTLEELEPLMEKDPRYYSAKHGLYIENKGGELITLLRYHLIKGCADNGIIEDADKNSLERRILRETGEDFSQKEYQSMAQFIHRTMIENYSGPREDVVGEAAVMNWLRGIGYKRPREDTKEKDVLFPRNWELFQALAKVNPFFSNFYEDYRRSKIKGDRKEGELDLRNIYEIYDFYVYARKYTAKKFMSEVRKALEKLKDGNATEADVEKEIRESNRDETKYDITPIFRMIWEFYDKKESQYMFHEVKSRNAVPKEEYKAGEEESIRQEKKRPVVQKGSVQLPSAKTLTRKEVFTHGIMIGDVLGLAAMDYFYDEIKREGLREENAAPRIVDMSLYLGGMRNAELSKTYAELNDPSCKDGQIIKELSRRFYSDVQNGVLDQRFKMEKGTFLKIYTIMQRLIDSYPKTYWAISQELDSIRREYTPAEDDEREIGDTVDTLLDAPREVKDRFLELVRKKDKIMGALPTEMPFMITTLHSRLRELENVFKFSHDLPQRNDGAEYETELSAKLRIHFYHDLTYMQELADHFRGMGFKLMGKNEAQNILDMYGIGEAMQLIPKQNFMSSD